MRKIKKIIIITLIIVFSTGVIVYSDKVSESIFKSINICLEVIIPSTFIFMVLSSYILSSGLYESLFRPLYKPLQKLIKADNHIISVFLLSLIGGYPVGFKLLKDLIAENKNYSEIVPYCAAFCYCISPSFAVTMLGIGLFRSIEAGFIIYISNVITSLIIAVFYSKTHKLAVNTTKIGIDSYNGKITESINSSVISLAKMCSVIIFFNSAITVFECFCSETAISILVPLKSLLEISNILNYKAIPPSALPFISSLASVGGLCVVFQCKSLIEDSFSLNSFFISRIFAAIISFITTKAIMIFWDISVPSSYSGNQSYIFNFNANKGATLFLLIMCIILMQKSEKNLKKG